MPRDNRMFCALHALMLLDLPPKRATSDAISQVLGTNPVVVRRLMAGLRDRGFVTSEKGHGGGWELKRTLDRITLLEVYEAIGAPTLFNICPDTGAQDCIAARTIKGRMGAILGEADALFRARLQATTVAEVAAEIAQDQAAERVPRGCDPAAD